MSVTEETVRELSRVESPTLEVTVQCDTCKGPMRWVRSDEIGKKRGGWVCLNCGKKERFCRCPEK